MTRQTRTIAIVTLCVLLLHIGAVWTLQRGLLMRPHVDAPPVPMQVRLVMPAAPADTTPAAPEAARRHKADRQNLAPARASPGVPATPTQVLQNPTAEPARTPAIAATLPAPPTSSDSDPAADAVVIKRSVATDDAASAATSASDAMIASTAPTARRTNPPLQMTSTDANYLQNPAPDYPPISRRLREQGTVLVDVLVTDQGLALETRIQKSSGFFRLDNAAVSTVATWRFVPGKRAGVAQSMWFTVPIDFRLQ